MVISKYDLYLDASMQLMPTGKAWNHSLNSVLAKTLGAYAHTWVRIDEDIDQLLPEFRPITSNIMLNRWEEMLGLPECGNNDKALDERRKTANSKFYGYGGSMNYRNYEELAKERGYDVEIKVVHPHHCLRACNYPLYNYVYEWTVEVHIHGYRSYRYFNVQDTVNTELRVGRDSEIECFFNRYAPASKEFVFIYHGDD